MNSIGEQINLCACVRAAHLPFIKTLIEKIEARSNGLSFRFIFSIAQGCRSLYIHVAFSEIQKEFFPPINTRNGDTSNDKRK